MIVDAGVICLVSALSYHEIGTQTPRRVWIAVSRGTRVPKTIADCFKYRNKPGTDIAVDALREALQARKANAGEILHYADICRVRNVIMPYFESLIL